jgi:hypothetical protein
MNSSKSKLQNQIDRLLSLGEIIEYYEPWMNYLDKGFKESDVPDLIKIATNKALYWRDATESAPIHAWRILGQLKVQAAVMPLINGSKNLDDLDFAYGDLVKALGEIGKNAIDTLAQCLTEPSTSKWSKGTALAVLQQIFRYNQEDQEIYQRIVAILTSCLKKPYIDDRWLNGSIVGALCELNEVNKIPDETIEVIRELYKNGLAALSIAGDIEDVEIELGVRKERGSFEKRVGNLLLGISPLLEKNNRFYADNQYRELYKSIAEEDKELTSKSARDILLKIKDIISMKNKDVFKGMADELTGEEDWGKMLTKIREELIGVNKSNYPLEFENSQEEDIRTLHCVSLYSLILDATT